jgi:hypothetical protein
VVLVGTEKEIGTQLQLLADSGVTEFFAAPFGTVEEQARTLGVLAP